MVTRPTPDSAKSTHILAAALALLWLAAGGYSQDAVSSPCSNNNAGCQHMCSLYEDIYSDLAYKCSCYTGYQLAEDKHKCDLIDEFLLYSQSSIIGGTLLKNISEGYTEAILPVPARYGCMGLDFDAHADYIYFSEFDSARYIYRIYRNGTHRETILFSKYERMDDLSIDWVTKNLYYIDTNKGTLNVLSTRNVTNKRVLLQNESITRLVLHPNKGYIFFSEYGVSRVNMDGSNLISFKYTGLYWNIGLAIDFAADRLYWCEPNQNLIYHSNLDLTDVISIKSRWINSPRLITTHKDWMYIINNYGSNSIIKLHKLTGKLEDKIEVQSHDDDFSKLYNLKIYSKYEQLIDNTHPCSMAANYGGCQKLCFAVPSNKSITSSLKAICGCLIGEKVDSDGKTCVDESKALTDSKDMVDSKAVIVSVSGDASRNIQYRYVTFVCFALVYLFTI
ncbi:low-density lipoprotein receptor-related protein 2-like [Myzus persicae]|uniref:low-density lipoprotein receptor-related protein 2-like n=1 Tax=Myzus persicae TaxID=13164 RepID=UPI000B93416D|nr:low-density lipoprotein receptor-related protein 2-like [Myzus persicae]